MKTDAENVFAKLQGYLMGKASELYSDKVLTLAYEPINVGEIENPDGFGYVKGSCGDTMLVFLMVADGTISDAKFLTDGCGATLACGSAVTDLARGKTPYEASKIQPQSVVRYLEGLPVSHLHCAVLAVQALRKALEDAKQSDKNATKR